MIADFTYEAFPGRVLFGAGGFERLREEAERLGIRRALVLSTPTHADQGERAAALLGQRSGGIFARARMHTPVDVTEQALVAVADHGTDGLVSVGGGSTIGLGKAIAFRTDLPQIVVPTTYAGSEMTDVLGETSDGVKKTHRSPRIRPETVIYDVELTLTLPARVSACSGLNAIAHAVEALYARDTNPLVALMAEEGVRALARALPDIVDHPDERNARSEALYGAWLCGCCLASAGMALHHKLCHVLGGAFNLPHAETHAILLPHTLAFNAPAVPAAVARLARALDSADPAAALQAAAARCGVPIALRDIGFDGSQLDRAIELALITPYWNPRPLDGPAIRALLARALRGDPPSEAA